MDIGQLNTLLLAVAVCASACSRDTRQRQRAVESEAAEEGGAALAAGRTVVQNKGSDSLVNVAQAWAEAYAGVDGQTAVAVTGGGTGTGVSALINRTADLANASRLLTDREQAEARKRAVRPQAHTVGYDAITVFVHKANPAKAFSLAQLADIYGEGGTTTKWSQLGVSVPGCGSDEIVRISRQNNSGTYEYFKDAVLGKGREFRLGTRDLHGSKEVADLVGKTPCAIGYSGLAYATSEVAMACVSKGQHCVVPTVETALNQTYPIARPLFMFTDGTPQGALKRYLDWILSDSGQCIIARKGYAPVRKLVCG